MSDPGRQRFAPGLWIVASSTLLSRILGMARDTVTANLFGVSPVTDALWLAFKIPNLARRLFGEGALTAAFLPAFSRELNASSGTVPESARQLAGAVFSLLAAALTGLVLAGEAGLWVASRWFVDDPHTRLLLGLTAVMLPYALLICLAAQLTAVLHALGRFTLPALVPVLLNVCWIASIWIVDPWFEPDRGAQAYALAVCVVSAGALQLALQWRFVAWLGIRLHAHWRENWPAAKEVFRAMLPVMFGLSIEQINALLDGVIAWGFSQPAGGGLLPWPGQPAYPLQTGAVSALYFGERMYQFPLGVFGIALGTVLFPLFARHAARGDFHRLRDDLSLGLRLVIALGVPASVGLIVVALPLTRVLFEHGEFTPADSQRTAALIVAYGTGVWAFCALPILYRGFYALGDRLSPMRVGMWAVLGDLILNLTLIWPLAERGLAFSTALSAVAQMSCLIVLLQRRVGRLDWPRLRGTAIRAVVATAAMAAACLGSMQIFPFDENRASQILGLVVPVVVSFVVYLAAARLLRMEEIGWLFSRHIPETDEGQPPDTLTPPPGAAGTR
ncbi:MAG: murein biosynthesis integral membrane protein MurJ [Planctomycetaceae bacterium]|nr:murein biosynthesis integral membrane protein MurJ [Planctomycetaceae bacterium]